MANMIDEYNEKVRKIKERRRQPGANKETAFQTERRRLIELLEEAEQLFYDLPFDKTNDDFKLAKRKVWSARKGLERLGVQVGKGYGWTLVEDEYPVHDTEVLVSLPDEEMMIARYDKDDGFLGYDRNLKDHEVKAWCEIPEWYDWENDEEERELTEEERKERARDFWIDLQIDEARGK